MTHSRHVVLDGALLRRDDARIAVDDLGFLTGDGLFETLCVQDGVPLFLDEHLGRLARGLELLRFASPRELAASLHAQVKQLLEAEPATAASARLRLTVTRGAGAAPGTPPVRPTVLVTLDAWRRPPEFSRGVTVEISTRERLPHPLHTIKSTSCASSLWLRREAAAADTYDVLQYNTRGDLAEGGFTNVFVVDEAGVLRTPAPEDGCLPGITRAVVLELAYANGLDVRVGAVARDVLAAAREAFLTSSLAGLVPIRAVAGAAVGRSCPGEITQRLQTTYTERVRRAVGGVAAERDRA